MNNMPLPQLILGGSVATPRLLRQMVQTVHFQAPRPRVAAVVEDAVAAVIAPLCGELRRAIAWGNYRAQWSPSETDLLVIENAQTNPQFEVANLYTIALGDMHGSLGLQSAAWRSVAGTEREIVADGAFVPEFEQAIAQLVSAYSGEAPPWLRFYNTGFLTPLVSTNSGAPIAALYQAKVSEDREIPKLCVVAPARADWRVWFTAFLSLVHRLEPAYVPSRPPLLKDPTIWLTPVERELHRSIAAVEAEIATLEIGRGRLMDGLRTASDAADLDERAVLWSDGPELETSVARLLRDLGFVVEEVDATIPDGAPRREDFRITDSDHAGWMAIAEVKGYKKGARTNDLSQQLRTHRDRFIADEARVPDSTWWIVNYESGIDPGDRRALGNHVDDTAKGVGATAIAAHLLYRLWAAVMSGDLPAETARQSLRDADAGVWALPT